jgi:hypothetical protein
MFSKVLVASLFIVSSLSGVYSHAIIAPALGVSGTAARSDVQRLSANTPCGNINVAQNIDTSTAVPLNADGTFSVYVFKVYGEFFR